MGLFGRFGVIAGLTVASLAASPVLARECDPAAGEIVSAEGLVEVNRGGSGWGGAETGELLCEEDTVRTGRNSRAAISLLNDAVLRLDQSTTVRLVDITPEPEERSFLSMIAGAIQSFSRDPRRLEVDTPYLNATVEGTEFALLVEDGRSELTMLEGQVKASNDEGSVRVTSGQIAEAAEGMPPTVRLIARPRDAVQWALYYPPILEGDGSLPPDVAEARRLARVGRYDRALEAMDRAPEGVRDARYEVYRAELLLNVGRVDEARTTLDRARAKDADNAAAHALAAIIDVVRNDRDGALQNASRAVELDPDGVAPKIALSYAQQAHFDLQGARQTLVQATEQNPDSAVAWARLSELWLATGYRDRSRAAGDRAVEMDARSARAFMVRGFAALTEFDTAAAKADFAKSIELDPANPMPHLGLGLAKIKEGQLEEGRGDIDVAVAMDSNSSLLRSYLGKAYFEENRNEISAEQLKIAKDLDPNDPTPHLYDAIRLQTENRPGEALAELRKSIEKNDNRAVYRGQLQLDQDRAARQTSLARVYNDLGFKDDGQEEAAKSLSISPSNAAAHRFLSDSYRGERRRETSRVSELLQSQMLQDVNLNPVQPSFSETNLNIVTSGGPAEAGLNEFTPLFEENGIQAGVTGQIGNNDTLGGEVVVSGVQDWFSASAGAFGYETDGWRDNHDLNHTIVNGFAQAAITPELNVMAEFRRRETEHGDLAFNFDADTFRPDFNRELDQDIAQGGLRYAPTPNWTFLGTVGYTEREETQTDIPTIILPGLPPLTNTFELSESDEEGYLAEGQVIYERGNLNVVAGGSYADVDVLVNVQSGGLLFGFIPLVGGDLIDSNIQHTRGYAYANLTYPMNVVWTLGLSVEEFDESEVGLDETDFNPKVGVQAEILKGVTARAAYIETTKPALVTNRTLEPTQVAGFNQFFDDANATRSTRYGVGLDWQATRDLSFSAEATWRDLDDPVQDVDLAGNRRTFFEDRDEQRHSLTFTWLPWRDLAARFEKTISVTGGVVYDDYQSENGLATTDNSFVNVPERVESLSFPFAIRYFDPSGVFGSVGATYVDQEVDRSQFSPVAGGDDQFVTVDLGLGYRLPNRMGVASLTVMNLFDSEFSYQDDSFREFSNEPSIGPYFPDRTFIARVSLIF